MQEKEEIKVYIDVRDGETVCICHREQKGCYKNCAPDVVERDKFAGWERTMLRDRYGKSR